MTAPVTPFEGRGRVAPWTSLPEGEVFMDALLAYSPKLSAETVGASVQGKTMRLFKMGTGPRKILFVAQQHGSELSGREAMFTRLRDWADSSDPVILDYLSKVTVLCIPTAHPDNDTVRENVNGVNLNRDHVGLSQPETRAVHAAIRDYRPEVIVDLHEGQNISKHFATSPALNPNIDAEIRALSLQLSNAVKSAITGAGYTWELYQGGNISGPEYFQNAGGLRNAVTVLLETERDYGDDSDAGERHSLQLIAVDKIREWHAANLETVSTVIAGAKNRVTVRRTPMTLVVGTDATGPALDPLPMGYVLTTEDHENLTIHRDRLGITTEPHDGGHMVTMRQESQGFIPYLMDQSSTIKLATGTRDFTEPPAVAPPVPLVPIGNKIALRFGIGGRNHKARLSGGIQ